MHVDVPIATGPGSLITTLDTESVQEMMALTGLVYPGYFRPRTIELGNYIGIHEGGRLVAMAGERMWIGPWREISAVCTHPEHLGRGHAYRLAATLVNSILRRGMRPFLHVSAANERALALYRRLAENRSCVFGIHAIHGLRFCHSQRDRRVARATPRCLIRS